MSTPKLLCFGVLLGILVAFLQGCGGGGPDRPPKPEGTTVVVGSAGCDAEDTHCKDDKFAEHQLKFLTVTDDGKLHGWTSFERLPGNAAWFAVSNSCLFVTYPDADAIDSFKWTAEGLPDHVVLATTAKGANPVFADVSLDGKTLVVANYHGPDNQKNSSGAGVQTYSIASDCSLTAVDFKPHHGSSVDKARQLAAHPHSTVVGRKNLIFVCDLGMDIIFTYNISSSGHLTELARTPTKPGAGPRHSVLHPTKDYLFVLSEMACTVSVYQIEASGKLSLLDEVSTLPASDPKSYGSKAAELAIAPDGQHLYASNRIFAANLSSTIAVYDVDAKGSLTLVQQVDCPAVPRGMIMMPDGKNLLSASQRDGEVASFNVSASTGHLTMTKSSQKGPWGAAAFAVLVSKKYKKGSIVV